MQIALNSISLGTDNFTSVIRLPYRAGYVFSACAAGASPSTEAPCDLRAQAWHTEEGDLSQFLVVSPTGVSLEAPIGTRTRIQYTVSNNEFPRLSASTYRIVEIVSPCASREFFCDGECKQVRFLPSRSIALPSLYQLVPSTPYSVHYMMYGSFAGALLRGF